MTEVAGYRVGRPGARQGPDVNSSVSSLRLPDGKRSSERWGETNFGLEVS